MCIEIINYNYLATKNNVNNKIIINILIITWSCNNIG